MKKFLLFTLVLYFLIPSRALAQVVINEIMYNPDKVPDSSGEWFELYNAGESDVSLEKWRIFDNGSNDHTIPDGASVVASAKDYLVLCRNGDSSVNGGVSCGYVFSFQLGNSEDEIILEDVNGLEIDRVEYASGKGFPDQPGTSIELVNIGVDNNLASNWHLATSTYSQGDKGTPGSANSSPPPPTPTNSPVPTAEPTPEPTDKPASTPKPTSTPNPTSSPTLSSTSTPTPTGKPSVSATPTEEEEEESGEDVLGLREKLVEPSPTPSEENSSGKFPVLAGVFITGGLGFIGAAGYPLYKDKLKRFRKKRKDSDTIS